MVTTGLAVVGAGVVTEPLELLVEFVTTVCVEVDPDMLPVVFDAATLVDPAVDPVVDPPDWVLEYVDCVVSFDCFVVNEASVVV